MAATKITKNSAPDHVSLALSDFSEGGGIFPEGRYRMDEVRFVYFDYDRKGPNTLSMRLKATPLGVEGAQQATQQYSLGKQAAIAYAPSADGCRLTLVPDSGVNGGLKKGSNFHEFLTAIINAGFPETKWEGDVSVFDGVEAFFTHKAMKEYDDSGRGGLTGEAKPKEERKFPKTLPVPSRDVVMPGEKSAAAPAAAKAKSAASEEVLSQLAADLTDVLAANPEGIGKGKARLNIFQAHKAAKLNKELSDAVINAYLDDATLTGVLTQIGYALNGSNIQPA